MQNFRQRAPNAKNDLYCIYYFRIITIYPLLMMFAIR
jgi:hypothetical protein